MMGQRRVTVVVVGGGHNGLAMSKRLSDRGVDHVVLEKGDVAGALRSIEVGLAAAAAQKDDLFTARLLLLHGNAEQASGQELEARRNYADATAQFHVLKNDEGRLATLTSLAGLEMHKGDNAAAEAHLAAGHQVGGGRHP